MRSIWIGFDARETAAFAVARSSARRHLSSPIPIHGLVQDDLRSLGLYRRTTERRKSAVDGDITWDLISDAPESTSFSNTRFLTPHLARQKQKEAGRREVHVIGQREPIIFQDKVEPHGWALFMDCDVLIRADLNELFDLAISVGAIPLLAESPLVRGGAILYWRLLDRKDGSRRGQPRGAFRPESA